ncbi:hypothetical protein WMY93_010027 [Mugilogobius chulae]|uniref:Uncharacterized protein n=1 Tax=Mugilogobius chulae TaxID=88201 RepID=A0AAW0P6D2_9GOBI
MDHRPRPPPQTPTSTVAPNRTPRLTQPPPAAPVTTSTSAMWTSRYSAPWRLSTCTNSTILTSARLRQRAANALNSQTCPGEDASPKLIKTEQLSPGHAPHCSSTPPLEYTCLSSSQSEYGDLQSPALYGSFSAYSAGLYQYPYFHSPHRAFSLTLAPPPHSPTSAWDTPIFTTLTRP